MSCNICCENYNKSTRTKICCMYCDFDVCRMCCGTYILSENVPKCMKPDCAKEWTRQFLRKNFTNSFLNSKYKTHLENVLYEQEKSLLPATQIIVEEKKRKENIKRQLNELNKLIENLYIEKKILENQYHYNHNIDEEKGGNATGIQFVRQCPSNNCRGFLSTQWKCGICEQWTCPDCHELKGFERDCEHTCDPNNVKTAKLIKNDSKPCPKCQSLIFKIDGCSQIWCTQCHTAFDWKTGKLESHIHNPHYFEWMRSHGGGLNRAPGDVECGRDIDNNTGQRFLDLCKRHRNLRINEGIKKALFNQESFSEDVINVIKIIRNLSHNHYVILPRFQLNIVERNQDLRVKYMENEISEEEFKILIQRSDKKHKHKREIAQVIQLSNTTLTDIVYRLMDNLQNSENGNHNLASFLREMEEIKDYCNNIFLDIAYTYNTIPYQFEENFEFIRVEKEKNGKN
jgi:hypothetical protein